MPQRQGTVTFQGNPLTLVGDAVNVGDPAPDFTAIGTDLKPVALSSLRGKVVVILAVPSLDTPVCDTEVRRFNEEAGRLGPDVAVLTVSRDLPFAQARWCGGANIRHVKTVSDYRDAAFGMAYGVLIQELQLLARALFVVDRDGVIRYIQIVPEVADEPDYEAALDAVRKLA